MTTSTVVRPLAGRARRRQIEVGAAIVALCTPIAVALIHARWVAWVPTADNALIEMQALDVPSRFPLVGVYSRFGFHHPGPLLFVIDSLPAHLLGPKGLLIATAMINMAAVGGLAILFERRGGRALLLAGTVVTLLLVRALSDQLLNPWNPWITTLPFALFVVALWSVACRDWRVLPLVAFTGTFLIQTHLGFTLLVAATLVPCLVWAVISWNGRRRLDLVEAHPSPPPSPASEPAPSPACSGRVLLFTIAALIVLWAPPIIDQLTQNPTNASLIAGALADPREPPAGPGQAWDVTTHALGTSAPWITGREDLEGYTNRVVGAGWWTLVPTLLVSAAALAIGWRSRKARAARHALWWQGIVMFEIVIGAVSIMRITGDAYPYLVRWTWVLGAFIWLSAGWTIFVARRNFTVHHSTTSDPTRSSSALAIGVAAILTVTLFASVTTWNAPVPARQDAEMVLAVVNPSIEQLRGQGLILIRHEGQGLSEVAMGVAAELERRGIPVAFEDADALAVGHHRVLGDRRPGATLLVAVRDAAGFHLGTGEIPIAGYDELSRSERIDYEELAKRGAIQYGDLLAGKPFSDPLNAGDKARLDDLHPRSGRVFLFLTRWG